MRRKLFSIIICAALLVQLLPASKAGSPDSGIVRVKLSIGTPSSVIVFLDGNYSVSDVPLERQMYTVKLESGKLNLYLGSSKITSGSSIYLTRHAVPAGENNYLWLKNTLYGKYLRYLGDMSFSISGGAIQVVNYIYVEDYLYGVLPYEMNDSFPAEALKAQAVAARNYTVSRIDGSGSYDITDASAYDQVYRGYNPAYTNSIAAVDATSGQVLMSGTAIIDAYYSASNGGRTELPYHRWGGGYDWDYYQITDDPYDLANPSSRNETIIFPLAIDETHPITTSGTGTANVSRAVAYIKSEILASRQLSDYGVDSVNDFEFTGITALKANTYDCGGAQDHDRMPKIGVNNCLDMIKATGDFTVSVKGTTVSVTGVTIELDYLSGALSSAGDKYVTFSDILGAFAAEPVLDDTSAVIGFALSQRRFGHGCGLSQRGAQQRAKSEDPEVNTYDNILGFYYPGAVLQTLPVAKPELTESPSGDFLNATVTDEVNVRSGPGSGYSVLAGSQLPPGMRLEVSKPFCSPDWHEINYGGRTAYVNKDYIALDTGFMFPAKYNRTRGLLRVLNGTTPAELLADLTYSAGTAAVYDALGAPYTGEVVGTGITVALKDGERVTDRLTVVVPGDTNGDGVIDIIDYTMTRRHLLNLVPLEGVQLQGADANADGVIDILDYTLIRRDLLGIKSIN